MIKFILKVIISKNINEEVAKSFMNKIKEKNYILFDLDGTLTDPMIGITKSFQYALNKFDIKVENLNELCRVIGPPLKNSFMDFYNLNEEDAEKAIVFYREYYSDKGIFENFAYENIEKLLNMLKDNNKKIIVATSKPTVFANQILDHFNLSKYFDFVSGSNLDGTRVKKDEVIKFVLEENNITDVSEVVMIGDREHDVIGAKKLGIESIGVLYGYGNYDELSNAGANYIVKDVNELMVLLS